MTRDLNKGIKDIKYNELNLPESISFADGRDIYYLYDYNICDVRAVADGAGNYIDKFGITHVILEGCLLISGNDWQCFKKQLTGVTYFR